VIFVLYVFQIAHSEITFRLTNQENIRNENCLLDWSIYKLFLDLETIFGLSNLKGVLHFVCLVNFSIRKLFSDLETTFELVNLKDIRNAKRLSDYSIRKTFRISFNNLFIVFHLYVLD